jgi:hypothetical protein
MQDGAAGTHIAGNAGIGKDFVGRDHQNSGTQVHVAMDRLSDASDRSHDQIGELSRQIAALSVDVTALTRALIGDARYGSTGLVQQVAELSDDVQRRERWRQMNVAILVAVALSQIAQWWLIWRVYQLYWVIYQAVGG